jgi:hypothetical protein
VCESVGCGLWVMGERMWVVGVRECGMMGWVMGVYGCMDDGGWMMDYLCQITYKICIIPELSDKFPLSSGAPNIVAPPSEAYIWHHRARDIRHTYIHTYAHTHTHSHTRIHIYTLTLSLCKCYAIY